MARDSISLGPTPSGEDCQQLGSPTYDPTAARQECARFRDLIIATLGEPPAGARFRVASNSHDFGTYYELEIVFDDEDDAAIEYAYLVEGSAPEYWPENQPEQPNRAIVEFHQ